MSLWHRWRILRKLASSLALQPLVSSITAVVWPTIVSPVAFFCFFLKILTNKRQHWVKNYNKWKRGKIKFGTQQGGDCTNNFLKANGSSCFYLQDRGTFPFSAFSKELCTSHNSFLSSRLDAARMRLTVVTLFGLAHSKTHTILFGFKIVSRVSVAFIYAVKCECQPLSQKAVVKQERWDIVTHVKLYVVSEWRYKNTKICWCGHH